MKIQAAVLPGANEPFQIQEVDLDTPGPGQILVRIVGAGLCHTDLVAAHGQTSIAMPAVLGHEGSGVVEQVGPGVTKVQTGDEVVITFLSCGQCPTCTRNEPAYCHSLRGLNFTGLCANGGTSISRGSQRISGNFFGQSSFATHALASERNVVKVKAGVPLEMAGTLGCGVQTGAGAIMRSLRCHQGSSLVIAGGGSVGLSAVMGAVIQQCRTIIVIEPSMARRELALSLGATHAIDPGALPELAAAVKAIVPHGVDFVLDTSGIPSVINFVPQMLAPRGAFGFVGIPPAHASDLALPGTLREVMRHGFTYRGIIEGDSDPDSFIPELMDLYLQGRFPFDRLVTTYPLADINRAVAEQQQGLCVKPVLLP